MSRGRWNVKNAFKTRLKKNINYQQKVNTTTTIPKSRCHGIIRRRDNQTNLLVYVNLKRVL